MSEWIYGFHAVEGILKHEPERIQELWLQSSRRDKRGQAIVELAANQGVTLTRVDRYQLDLEIDSRHQGVAARIAASKQRLELNDINLVMKVKAATNPLLLVLDGVTDPHNLGACLRSADAAGAMAVITPKDNSANLSPVVHKVACGAAETVPLVRVTNLARTLQSLKDAGIWIIGTTSHTDTTLYEQDLTGPIAIIVGAESKGMRRLTTEQCDFLVKLPMVGSVESLNASVATGICLFEALRQRIAP